MKSISFTGYFAVSYIAGVRGVGADLKWAAADIRGIGADLKCVVADISALVLI